MPNLLLARLQFVQRIAAWHAFTATVIAKSQMSVSERYGTVSKGQLLLT